MLTVSLSAMLRKQAGRKLRALLKQGWAIHTTEASLCSYRKNYRSFYSFWSYNYSFSRLSGFGGIIATMAGNYSFSTPSALLGMYLYCLLVVTLPGLCEAAPEVTQQTRFALAAAIAGVAAWHLIGGILRPCLSHRRKPQLRLCPGETLHRERSGLTTTCGCLFGFVYKKKPTYLERFIREESSQRAPPFFVDGGSIN